MIMIIIMNLIQNLNKGCIYFFKSKNCIFEGVRKLYYFIDMLFFVKINFSFGLFLYYYKNFYCCIYLVD